MDTAPETFDVVIVGAGPCGTSTAMHLLKRAPELARRTLVIDRAVHPRHKLCGGGLTGISQALLDRLDLDLVLNYVPIHEIEIRFEKQRIRYREQNAIKIVRRERFDAALVSAARERGAVIREGVGLAGLHVESDCVLLDTTQGQIRARAVVAADGAKSTVRRFAGLDGPSRVARLIEILTPEDPTTSPEFVHHRVVFDFTPMKQDLQGYVWDFPSAVDGEPYMNRGVFDSRVLPDQPMADLKAIFAGYLSARDISLSDFELMGNPGRWFDPEAQLSAPHILLAGDAAGIEPLVSDGISCAMWYGEVVAEELARAFESRDMSFAGYRERLLAHPLGQHMARRTNAARFLYKKRSPWAMRLVWFGMGLRTRLRSRRPGWLVHSPALEG
jgi:flavin-dependent dehydrogenase